MADDLASEAPRAPYLSFTTFMNFLDRLGDGPMPPRIDKGYLDSYSGGTQAILLSTLRTMELIDPDGRVEAALRSIARDQNERQIILRQWVDHFYRDQQQLAKENGTAQQLLESFGQYGYKGSTLRKAIVFYLALVEYVGAPSSPHFRPPRQASSGASRPRRRETAPPEQVIQPASVTPPTSGETISVQLGGAGTVTMTVDVRWLELPDDVFVALRALTKDLRALGSPEAPIAQVQES